MSLIDTLLARSATRSPSVHGTVQPERGVPSVSRIAFPSPPGSPSCWYRARLPGQSPERAASLTGLGTYTKPNQPHQYMSVEFNAYEPRIPGGLSEIVFEKHALPTPRGGVSIAARLREQESRRDEGGEHMWNIMIHGSIAPNNQTPKPWYCAIHTGPPGKARLLVIYL